MHKLFISHKHEDREIADVVASILKRYASAHIEIHHSSNSAYFGPKPNEHLDAALLSWLSQADGFLLIYTSKDEDWSYCMYEYGVVSAPETPPTNCYVLQCTSDKPTVLQGHKLTKTSDRELIRGFTKYFFDDKPFPSQTEKFCHWSDSELSDVANEFYDKLQLAIKTKKKIQWTNWPYMRISFPLEMIDAVPKEPIRHRIETVSKLLRTSSEVKESVECSRLFDYTIVNEAVPFHYLMSSWAEKREESPDVWIDDLAVQIVRILDRRIGQLSRSPIASCEDGRRRQMLVTQATRDDANASAEFQIIFLDLSDPKGIFVGDIMVPIQHLSYKVLYGADIMKIYLKDLIKDMEVNQQNRVVFLWREKTPAYIVELEHISRFLIKAGFAKDWADLAMDDLLKDAQIDAEVKDFAVVTRDTSLWEAREAMRAVAPECRNAFVTPTGVLGEVALGLLFDDASRHA